MKMWTTKEIDILKENLIESKEELQKLFPDRTTKSIIHKITNLNLPRKTFYNTYSKKEDAILRDNSMKTKEELLFLLPNRKWESICYRINALDLLRDKGWSFWSDTEIKTLLDCKTMSDAISKLNRSEHAIKIKSHKLNKVFSDIGERWSEEDEIFLKLNYNNMSAEQISTHLNRSLYSVYIKANRSGINKLFFIPDMDELYSLFVEKEMMIKDIASHYSVERHIISKHIPNEWRKYYNVKQQLNKNELHDLYIEKRLSLNDIGKLFNVSNTMIHNLLKGCCIEIRNTYETQIIEIDLDYAIEQYEHGLSIEKISKLLNISNMTLNKKFKSNGIPIREQSFYIAGKNHPNWKGGITPENARIRTSKEYKEWRNFVFSRDKYTCQCCGDSTGGNLHAHHIVNFSDNADERFNIANGIALCNDCHNPSVHGSFHNVYGVKNNTKEQLEEYVFSYSNN